MKDSLEENARAVSKPPGDRISSERLAATCIN